MKKVSCIILSLLIVFSMCITSAFAAASDATLTVTSSATTANVGDEITVSVDLSGEFSLGTLTFNIVYDAEKLEYVAGSLTTNYIFPIEEINDETAGSLLYTGFTGKAVTEGGTVVTAQFKVLKTGATVGVEVVEAYDTDDVDWATEVNENSSENDVTIACAHGTTAWETTKNETHTEDGSKSLICSVCDETVKTEAIPATGHAYGEWVVTTSATCKTEGEETRACSCGATETRKIATVAHTAGEWEETKAPTCTEKGEEVQKCTECKDVLDTREIPANGHSYGEWTVTTVPTCTEAGVETRECACGATEIREVPANGHSYGDWAVTTSATCSSYGVETRECSCGVTETREIPMEDCTPSEWEVVTSATCTENGEEVQKCTECGDVLASREIPATGHTAGEYEVTKEATCTETGEKEAVCGACDETFTEVIPALGHSFGDWVVTKEATVDVEGEKERVCSACAEKEIEVIAKLPAVEDDNKDEVEDTNKEDVENPEIPDTNSEVAVSAYTMFMFITLACAAASVIFVRRGRCK